MHPFLFRFRPNRPVLSTFALKLQRRRVRRETWIFAGGVAGLFWIASFLFGGWSVGLLAVGLAVGSVHLNSQLSQHRLLRFLGARAVTPVQAPQLHTLLERLSAQAELPRTPRLYWLPQAAPIAFTTGSGEEAAIALSEGLLHRLNEREIAAVLAHELAHQRHGDSFLLGLADAMRRFVGLLAWIGYGLFFLNLPVLFWWPEHVPWQAILFLLTTPVAMSLLVLALCRAREFAADLGSAELTGDPLALASALEKIDGTPRSRWEALLRPTAARPEEHYLRTHPPTPERVRRLLDLVQRAPDRFADGKPAFHPFLFRHEHPFHPSR